jgi:hypothetical protein
VLIQNLKEVLASETAEVTVSTSSEAGASVLVTVPASSMPAGATVQVSAIINPAQLEVAAPPPPGADILAGFQLSAYMPTGDSVADDFEPAVGLEFTVPRSVLPAGALALAFWDGSDWISADATITQNGDGSISASAEFTHFTLFAVIAQPPLPFGTLPPAGGFGLAVWRGLDFTSAESAAFFLAARAGGALYLLDPQSQRFFTYVVGAPAVVNNEFYLSNGEAVIVRTADLRTREQ